MLFSELGRPKPMIRKLIDNGWKPSVLIVLVLISPIYLLTAWQEWKNALQLIPYSMLLVNQIESDLEAVWSYNPK